MDSQEWSELLTLLAQSDATGVNETSENGGSNMPSATTPARIDDAVRAFLAEFRGQAVFVPVIPEKWAVEGYCSANVKAKVKVAGGRPMPGWCIWYAPGHFIEGECHCVWESPSGSLIDVTPKSDKEARILFVPDAEVGSGMHGFHPNRMKPLSSIGEAFVAMMAPVVDFQRQMREQSRSGWDSMLAKISKAAKAAKK